LEATRGKKVAAKKCRQLTPSPYGKTMPKNHGMSIRDLCKTLQLSRADFYRYVNLREASQLKPLVLLEYC